MSVSVLKKHFPLASLNKKQKHHNFVSWKLLRATYVVAFPTDLSTAVLSEGELEHESKIGYINGTS